MASFYSIYYLTFTFDHYRYAMYAPACGKAYIRPRMPVAASKPAPGGRAIRVARCLPAIVPVGITCIYGGRRRRQNDVSSTKRIAHRRILLYQRRKKARRNHRECNWLAAAKKMP